MPPQRKPFTADDVRKQGRLKKGDVLGGPEPYGCINSGVRPTLAHLNTPTDLYIVGPDCRAAEIRKALRQAEYHVDIMERSGMKPNARAAKMLRTRIHREQGDPHGRRTVFVFRSKAPAIAKFVDLCNVILDENAQDRANHQKAIADMRSPDPERRVRGALAAMDY